MKRGLYVAPFDELADPRLLVELARVAESRGWDGLFLWDQIAYPPSDRAVGGTQRHRFHYPEGRPLWVALLFLSQPWTTPKPVAAGRAGDEPWRSCSLRAAETAVLGPISAGGYGTWTGKWLVLVPAEEVDERWPAIAGATVVGFLGIATKVSTAAHPRNADGKHVICVYTADCQDHTDVARVLAMLRYLGYNGRLFYKEDGMTYAGRYGRGAALYVAQAGSNDFDQRREPVPVPPERLSSGMGAALAARTQ